MPRISILCLVLLGSATLAARADAPPSLEGRWVLVSQTYEGGQRQLGRGPTPMVLEFSREGLSWTGVVIWAGRSAAWPAYPDPQGFAELDPQRTRSFDADGRGALARYVVLPPEEGSTRLLVEERYRVDEEGRLVGTMEIRLESQDRDGGSFTWHRVFEREE